MAARWITDVLNGAERKDSKFPRADLGRRCGAERFFEQLVETQHGSAEGLAAACDAMHYYFLSVHDVAVLLDAMEERDMVHEDAMDMLHDGTLDLGDDSFLQLRRISSDMMQCRRHEGRPATPGRPDSPKR